MKKIILLALAAASVAAFALPATAMAVEEDVPVHAVGAPLNTPLTVDGEGHATLTGVLAQTITCARSEGTIEFTTTTTGHFEQTFHECVDGNGNPCTSAGQPSGTITTEKLEFHLLTVEDSVTHATGPGVLVTPKEVEAGVKRFARFTCGIIVQTVAGNGVIGTIKTPACGSKSNQSTIEFSSSSSAVQTHKTVVGTKEEYSLTAFGASASEDASGIITFGAVEPTLTCT